MALEGLFDFISMIKDLCASFIDGMRLMIDSLGLALRYGSGTDQFYPTAIGVFISMSVTLIVVLRVVGR